MEIDNEQINFNPRLTFVSKGYIKVPSERKYMDVSDDFRHPSVCKRENLARRIYSTLNALQQLSHVDDVVARAMMVSVPQLATKDQRDNLARMLNKDIRLDNGQIQFLCTTVSLSMKEVIVFVQFHNCDPLQKIFEHHYVQLVNDIVAALCAKFTIYNVGEASTNSLTVIGSVGKFDGSILGIQYFTLVYDNCNILTIIYCDPKRYKDNNKQAMIQMILLLTGNNISRIISIKGYPCSCIVLNNASLTKHQTIFQTLDKWERCLGFLIVKSLTDTQSSCSSIDRFEYQPELYQENRSRTSSIEQVVKDISNDELQKSITHINNETVQPNEIITKISQENKTVHIYIVTKRDPTYKQDAAIELKNLIKSQIAGDVNFLTTTPSSPQDLIQINLKIQNMRTYQCVKTVEQIMIENGSYNIEIDLASGFVNFMNTTGSQQVIVQALNESGFGCTLLQQQEINSIKHNIEQVSQINYLWNIWTIRSVVGFVCALILIILRLIYRTSSIITYINCAVSILLTVLSLPIIKSGIITSIKRKRVLTETENSIAVLINIVFSIVLIVLINTVTTQEAQELNKLDISNGTAAILTIVAIARFIEQYGKRNAIKNFQGLAQSLPEEVYVLKNINLDQLVRHFKVDTQTIQFQSGIDVPLTSQPEESELDFNEYIQQHNVDKILDVIRMRRSSLSSHMDIEDIQLASNHSIYTINLAALTPGRIIAVYRGETIPCDGYILSGFSPIDESFISKRHEGISKGPGDKVFAGTKVLSADIFICACAVGNDTLIGHLISAVKRSTSHANKILQERDDLHLNRELLNSNSHSVKIMQKYRPLVWLCTLIFGILWLILAFENDYFGSLVLKVYNINSNQKLVKYTAYIAFFVQTITCMLIVSSPFAFTMCFSLVSLVGTNLFGKQSLIIRDCTRVCQQLKNVKIIAFPRTGGLTYGKPLVTSIYIYLNINELINQLVVGGMLMVDCTKSNSQYYINQLQFDGIEPLIAYLSDPQSFNEFIQNNSQIQSLICDKAHFHLKQATSLILASSNGIIGGLVTCLRVLQEHKFTKYVSRQSSFSKLNIPYVQEYQYSPETGIYTGKILNETKLSEISILNTINTCYFSRLGHVCIQLSNLVDQIEIKALHHVEEEPLKTIFHVNENNQHVLDFVIADSLRQEAYNVIQELQKSYKVLLTSTDSKEQCYETAREVGIPDQNVYYDLKFEEKPKLLQKISKEQGKILYVCDGVNDLKCTAYVDVSLAISEGRDGIKAATDIVSLKCTLEDILVSFQMAKQMDRQLQLASNLAAILTLLLLPFTFGILIFAHFLFIPQIVCIILATIILIILFVSQSNIGTQKIQRKTEYVPLISPSENNLYASNEF
ncbi:Copper-transporting_P-type ATPase [Hexamita inflata]|uniref:Copper-transporting P-type ATPase n=1 Tax=Hexamita inflata TaxID=28002 RepID=A0AA86RA36_9EUKA|nr:Copper-transporting P-type ATPase [Hexamita inflata]CAI9972337.1 Copper-transporting P-type ATPase [Hexamita inflata]